MKPGIDYIGVTVVMYCHDGAGKLLLQKRSNTCRDEQGHWDCGGGALEFGESFEEGVKRELKEEYGCQAKKVQFGGVNNILRNNNGVETHWVSIVFAIQVDPADVKICDAEAIDELGWFTKEHLPKPLHSVYLKDFELIKKFI